MNLDEIQQIFFQECEEGLAAIEASFADIREGAYDAETINTVFRSVHSIKGGAGAFGHERLQSFSHHYETVLDKVRNGDLAVTDPLLTTLVSAFDMLSDHVQAAQNDDAAPNDAATLARLHEALGPGAAPAPTAEPPAAPPTAASDRPEAPMDFGGELDFDLEWTEAEVAVVADGWLVRYAPGPQALAFGSEPLLLLRELQALGGTVKLDDDAAVPSLDQLEPETCFLRWTLTLPATVEEEAIRAVFEFAYPDEFDITRVAPQAAAPAHDTEDMLDLTEDLSTPLPEPAEAKPVPAPSVRSTTPALTVVETPPPPQAIAQSGETSAAARQAAAAGQTIRVDLDKLDRLVNLVGELVITQAMLAQRLSEHELGDISELTDLDHLTRELQDSTMAIRAQPMKTVFSRVPRIIRELEAETGKRVRLDVEGEMTEVDKTVVERIGEPLTHLIRNAVDHGLETPDERIANGKPAEGVVRLTAAHQSGRIVITIADDGRGIDRVKVRAKAIERQIVAPDAQLSDEEIDNLIFAPGFSTADTVSNISGRGVGMDVVRKNVQALGGRIGIQSQIGKGSSFSLSLPLTLAVLDGMIVTVGAQTFVVPLGHIVESLRPTGGEVKTVGPGAWLLEIRGAYVPIQAVGEHLGIGGCTSDPHQAVLIVVESDQGQVALMVDGIQDQRQVVVKSLEANYQAIEGLAGATILGDGRVALILDPDSLISRWRHAGRALGQVQALAA